MTQIPKYITIQAPIRMNFSRGRNVSEPRKEVAKLPLSTKEHAQLHWLSDFFNIPMTQLIRWFITQTYRELQYDPDKRLRPVERRTDRSGTELL